MKRTLSIVACVAALLCAIVTFVLTVLPLNAQQRAMISQRDKLIHAAVFAILTTCVAWALSRFLRRRLHVLMLTAVLLVVFAAGDELAQRLVPTRTVDLKDWLANCVGILIGLVIYALITRLSNAIVAKGDSDLRRSSEE